MITPLPPTEEEIGLIEGQIPDSKEEYWAAQALWKYEIPFMYQFEIFGGTSRRGGIIVDFVVWNPRITPFPIHGNYWHQGELKGGDRAALLAMSSYFNIPVEHIPILWGSDAQTKEDVFRFVRDNVARY